MAHKVAFIVVAFIGIVYGLDIPDFLRVCKRNHPNIDACITDSVENLRPYLAKGVEEYNIPTLEPLMLGDLFASETAGLRVTAKDIKAYGASNYIVKRVKVDMENLIFNVDIAMPHLYVVGTYEIDGRVLLLPIKGSGGMTGNFTDCTGIVVFKAALDRRPDGTDGFKVIEFDLKITVGKGNMQLDNLFNGDKVLGEVINNAINSNFETFAAELLPIIQQALSDAFLKIGENIVAPYSYDQLFPE